MRFRRVFLGLTGVKESGKDEAAKYLVENYRFYRIAYADILKEVATKLGWSGDKTKDRQFLIDLAEAIRTVDHKFWVHAALGRVVGDPLRIVVSDLRYADEVETAWEWMDHICSSSFINWPIFEIDRLSTEGTSREIETIDALKREYEVTTIQNNMGIKDLHAALDDHMEALGIDKVRL